VIGAGDTRSTLAGNKKREMVDNYREFNNSTKIPKI
jgi:hypothetical protein